jgi:NADH-quinone oxidoreductase subunit N
VNASAIAASQVSIFRLLVPEMILGAAACLLFLGSTFRPGRHLWGCVGLLALVIAGGALWRDAARVPTIEARQLTLHQNLVEVGPNAEAATREVLAADEAEINRALFTHSVLHSQLGLFTRFVALAGGFILMLLSWNEVPDRWAAEYHACLLVIVAGTGLTAIANDLVTLFLALELVSIPTYLILYLQRTDQAAQEAAAKYFLLSIFTSALSLFGFSYLYGLAGTTNIPALLNALHAGFSQARSLSLLAIVAVVMVVAGMGFRITAVPFHFYAPDVYQGTATSAAAFLAFMPKVGGFVALLRVLGFVWSEAVPIPGLVLGLWAPTFLFCFLAALTMTIGNVTALLQDNLKRLLAYSSVAHAGYMLIGLAAAPGLSLAAGQDIPGGPEAILFYLVAYGAMTLGAFAVLSYLSTPERSVETVDDLAGLGHSHPGVALMMLLFLLSLIGIPLTVGFAGKFLIFFGALALPADASDRLPDIDRLRVYATWLRVLALVGALNAAMGGWYYLRIVAAMYLRSPLKPIAQPRSWPGLAALWLCAALTLGLGVYPKPLVEEARKATTLTPQRGPETIAAGRANE